VSHNLAYVKPSVASIKNPDKACVHTMIVIEGRENVQAFWQKVLDRHWELLDHKYRNVRGKIAFALLLMMNYKLGAPMERDGSTDTPLEQDILRFRLLMRTLDVLLARDWTQIDFSMKPEDVPRYVKLVESAFLRLGMLRNMLLTVVATKQDRLTVAHTQQESCVATQGLDSAFEQWWKLDHLDGDWIQYYYNHSTKGAKIAEQIRKELSRKYGTTQEGIHDFGRAMSRRIRANLKQLKVKEAPFLCLSREDILTMLRSTAGPRAAETLSKEIEYAPGKSWPLSPFVKLMYNRDAVYVPFFSAFYPVSAFSESWIDHVTREVKDSSAKGMMGRDWGEVFEDYVRQRLRDCHPHLTVDPGNTVIDPSKFPDIEGCLGKIRKRAIEIDVIAYSERRLYLISCKAPDQFSGPDMIRSLQFLGGDEFEDRLESDIRMAGEIEEYSHCVRQSTMYLKSRGFEEKEVAPVLVTSDFRPLGLAAVHTWMLKDHVVPDTIVIQAKRLEEFPFE